MELSGIHQEAEESPSPRAHCRHSEELPGSTASPAWGSMMKNVLSGPHQVMGIASLGSKEAFQQTSNAISPLCITLEDFIPGRELIENTPSL